MNKKGWFCVTDFVHVEPDCSGFYAIYKFNIITFKKSLLYIGTADNLRNRLANHAVKKALIEILEYPELIMIKCKIFQSKLPHRRSLSWFDKQSQLKRERLNIEAKLINRLKPPFNKRLKNGFKRSTIPTFVCAGLFD